MEQLLLINKMRQRNTGLDLMRSFAITLVFFGHTMHLFDQVWPAGVNYFSLLAKNGVELFFSLSGFLIGNILISMFAAQNGNAKELFRFYRRRWFRTFPLYYLGIGINLLTGILITGNYKDLSWKFLVFSQNLYETGFFFFPVSYSLSIEEWFYLFFPFMLLLLVKLVSKDTRKMMLVLSLCCIITATVLRFWFYKDMHPHWDAVMRKTIVCRIDAGIYGVLMAVLYNKRQIVFERYKWLFLGAGIIIYATCMYGYLFLYESAFNYVIYFNLIPLSCAFFIPWFHSLSISNINLRKGITWLSLASFAIYIVHLNPIMEILVFYIPLNHWAGAYSALLLTMATSLGLAYLLNKYIEQPLLNMEGKWKR